MNELIYEPSLEMYQSIVEHNPQAVFILSADGLVLKMNGAACTLLGYTPEQVQGQAYTEIFAPEDKSRIDGFTAVAKAGNAAEYEAQAVCFGGEKVMVQISSIPLQEKGAITAIFCTMKAVPESGIYAATRNADREGKFEALFRSAVLPLFILDLDGRVVEVNDQFEAAFGWKQEEIVGFMLPIIPESCYGRHQEIMEQCRSGTIWNSFDAVGVKKDGASIEISSAFTPIRNNRKEIIGIVGHTQDITERKKLARTLQESEERYRSLVEASPEGIIVHKEGTILYANPSAMTIAKVDAPIGQSLYTYIPAEYHESTKKRIEGLENREKQTLIEIEVNRCDGTKIYIDTNSIPITHETHAAILTMFRDVTEKRIAEAEWKESEKRYRLLADNSLDLIQLVNLDGIVTYASPSHKAVIGYDPEEYIGKWVFYQPDEGIDPVFRDIFMNMVITQKPFVHTIQRKHTAGHEVWVELIGKPVFDEGGDFKNMMLVGREVTERKRYEERLKFLSYRDALTGSANRRLFQAKLEQAVKAAAESGGMLAVMYMDLDGFKQINDQYGHDAGDELLQQFAKRVESIVEEGDLFARMGGDEFALMLTGLYNPEEATATAKQILYALQQPWQLAEIQLVTTSSIGIAHFEQGDAAQELLKKADTALYQAKFEGKNKYCTYH
ncbi:PAS domain S-box protein [Paenibacillus sp. NEAU-GSW1]|uniref:sensor domain-containing diguanylate cyclase n=1 Tax=Paenibacillus sp. NEAU-GSW1 TaxID=2682486 RepID=UPI0012E20293|nr:PAS domain S-box protein [Paenibacillus sp. NEAU-GSW1]MUT65179.1 PAS domain S-box protein [Paenibacillus sp. NEAU-GSW1]